MHLRSGLEKNPILLTERTPLNVRYTRLGHGRVSHAFMLGSRLLKTTVFPSQSTADLVASIVFLRLPNHHQQNTLCFCLLLSPALSVRVNGYARPNIKHDEAYTFCRSPPPSSRQKTLTKRTQGGSSTIVFCLINSHLQLIKIPPGATKQKRRPDKKYIL